MGVLVTNMKAQKQAKKDLKSLYDGSKKKIHGVVKAEVAGMQ
jgi:hypothetical protein